MHLGNKWMVRKFLTHIEDNREFDGNNLFAVSVTKRLNLDD